MTEPLDPSAWVREWVEKAEHDLAAAERLIESGRIDLSDIVCFHAQQCAEKFLKAMLAYRGVEFLRTHDLVVLLHRVRERDAVRLEDGDLSPLNRFATEARYPGGWDPIGQSDAAVALELARKVRDAVRPFLPRNERGGIPRERSNS